MEKSLEPGEGVAVGEDDLADRGTDGAAPVVERGLAEALPDRVAHAVVLGEKPVDDVVARDHRGAVAREGGERFALPRSDSPRDRDCEGSLQS